MKTLGITLGDPSGIGPEITAKALDFFCRKKLPFKFILLGNKNSFLETCKLSNIKINTLSCIKEFIDIKSDVKFIRNPTKEGGEVSYQAICRAAELFKEKKIAAIITAPISKKSLHLAKHYYDGHTGLLGDLFKVPEPYLMLANKKFSTRKKKYFKG